MINTLALTAGTSMFGLITGFIFRLIGESRKSANDNMQLAIRALAAGDLSADKASERKGTGWLRWVFGMAVITGVVIIPAVVGFMDDKTLLYPMQKDGWSLLWGFWSFGSKTVWVEIKGYPYIPEMLQAFNLYISFVVGQKPAK